MTEMPKPYHYSGTLQRQGSELVGTLTDNSLGYQLKLTITRTPDGAYAAHAEPGPVPPEWDLGDYEP